MRMVYNLLGLLLLGVGTLFIFNLFVSIMYYHYYLR
jgi:hypothetical protein